MPYMARAVMASPELYNQPQTPGVNDIFIMVIMSAV